MNGKRPVDDAAELGLGQGLRVAGSAAATVPEPGGLALLGLGLVAVGVMRRRRQD